MKLIFLCFFGIIAIHLANCHRPWGCFLNAGLDPDPEPPNIPPLITTPDNDWIYPEIDAVSSVMCPPHLKRKMKTLLRVNHGQVVNLACPGSRFANSRLNGQSFITAQ